MYLFKTGSFTLANGKESRWKIECDALSDADWDSLAALVRVLHPRYSSVEGVPLGGHKLADRLSETCTLTGPHLIVDDVLTTGESMERVRQAFESRSGRRDVEGVVVFARGQPPVWVEALFAMPEEFWPKARTRG